MCVASQRRVSIALAVIFAMFASDLLAQSRFELVAPNLGVASQAVLTQDRLEVISSQGIATVYLRETKFDSRDGQWLGYYSRNANQVLLWPTSNSGNMQIGSVQGNSVAFRPSQMTIRYVGGEQVGTRDRIAGRPVLPPPMLSEAGTQLELSRVGSGNLLADLKVSKLFDLVTSGGPPAGAEMLRLASLDGAGSPWLLTRGSGLDLSCTNSGSAIGVDWWVAPAGADYVRVQTYDRDRVYAVSAQPGGSLELLPVAQDPNQLWRVSGVGRVANRFFLENVSHRGHSLTRLGGGHLALQPINFLPTQMWVPYHVPAVVNFQPFWRSVSTELIPNAPLPPAQLELDNSHRNALVVLLGNSRQGASVERIRIEPNRSQTVSLQRDSGATIIESVEIRSSAGLWDRQQLITAVPPSALYDLSVYEEHLQSIAIDATGKSPNPIEDVNYVPKSVGWLPLPPGTEMPVSGRLDVYALAKSANNPGAVRRMDPKEFDESPTADPLESILNKFQSPPRRKF